MKKEGRGEEHDTTTQIQIFTHASCVINLACMNFICTDSFQDPRASWACTILLLAVVLQSYCTSITS